MKQEFIQRHQEQFKSLLSYYGNGMIRNRIHVEVNKIAEEARKELDYSPGTKSVYIVNHLYRQFLKTCNITGVYANRVTMDEKVRFIERHIMYFEVLFNTVGNRIALLGGLSLVKEIAEKARIELGYSEKTAPIDIVRILYGVYLEKYR